MLTDEIILDNPAITSIKNLDSKVFTVEKAKLDDVNSLMELYYSVYGNLVS